MTKIGHCSQILGSSWRVWPQLGLAKYVLNPIPTGHGRNQPIYERHVTTAGRNRVKGHL